MSQGMRRWIRLPVYILLMILLPAAVFFGLPDGVPYSITETYVFTSGGGAGREVFLEVMIPRGGPYQEVGEVSVDWNGTAERIGADGAEFDILRLAGKTGSDGTARAVLSYLVEVAQGAVSWNAPVTERDLHSHRHTLVVCHYLSCFVVSTCSDSTLSPDHLFFSCVIHRSLRLLSLVE